MTDFVIHPDVRAALASGGAIVALESTIISHGLPYPRNLEVAREIEQAVRSSGAVPATIAVINGAVHVGLDDAALQMLADPNGGVVKVSTRDLGAVMAKHGHGATTVSATSTIAHKAGIQWFATGGLGGVHREANISWDESADLVTLASVPINVVCAGVKSILDIGATLERLETFSVTVAGYRTDRFPGFYRSDSGYAVPWRVDTPTEAAAVAAARNEVGAQGAFVLAQPVSQEDQLDAELHDRTLREGMAAAAAAGISGKDATPFLLDWFHTKTGGASLEVNIKIILANARLAAECAAATAARG